VSSGCVSATKWRQVAATGVNPWTSSKERISVLKGRQVTVPRGVPVVPSGLHHISFSQSTGSRPWLPHVVPLGLNHTHLLMRRPRHGEQNPDKAERLKNTTFAQPRLGPASNASAGPPCVHAASGAPARLSCRLSHPATPKASNTRKHVLTVDQNSPITSPASRVPRARQTPRSILLETARDDPSTSATCTIPG